MFQELRVCAGGGGVAGGFFKIPAKKECRQGALLITKREKYELLKGRILDHVHKVQDEFQIVFFHGADGANGGLHLGVL